MKLKLGFPFKEVYQCDLLENNVGEVAHAENTSSFAVKPYEIVTLKFVL